MKKKVFLSCFLILLLIGCTKSESEQNVEEVITGITLSSSQINSVTGQSVTFNVTSNLGGNLNDASVFFVNDVAVPGNTYTFTTAGTFAVKASYQSFVSNIVQIVIVDNTPVINQYVSRVLVEEYSGTWCGNCPRILYGTELLKQQTDKSVTVQIHLFNNDPFITSQGNSLATSQGVSTVPTGKINRTINWNGPQYQNVNQVIGEVDASSNVGVAITSSLTSNTLNASIKMGFADQSVSAKLVVYLVEDNLFNSQANYSANLYGGLSSIPNFEYDGVLRAVISNQSGDSLIISGTEILKNYTLTLPTNVSNNSNIRIVAFLVDANTNSVLNVRQANVGENQNLEILN